MACDELARAGEYQCQRVLGDCHTAHQRQRRHAHLPCSRRRHIDIAAIKAVLLDEFQRRRGLYHRSGKIRLIAENSVSLRRSRQQRGFGIVVTKDQLELTCLGRLR